MTDLNLAEATAAALDEDGEYSAAAWEGDRPSLGARVYVQQLRSGGRSRGIGHLTILGGEVDASAMSHRKGTVRSIAEETVAAIFAEEAACVPAPAATVLADVPRRYALPGGGATDEETFWHDPEEPREDLALAGDVA